MTPTVPSTFHNKATLESQLKWSQHGPGLPPLTSVCASQLNLVCVHAVVPYWIPTATMIEMGNFHFLLLDVQQHNSQSVKKRLFRTKRLRRDVLCPFAHATIVMHSYHGLPNHIVSELQPKRHSQPHQNPSSNGFIQTGQYNAQNQRPAKNSVGRPVGNYALAFSPCRAYSSLLAPEASQLENFQ